jgi:hypothetical protein
MLNRSCTTLNVIVIPHSIFRTAGHVAVLGRAIRKRVLTFLVRVLLKALSHALKLAKARAGEEGIFEAEVRPAKDEM